MRRKCHNKHSTKYANESTTVRICHNKYYPAHITTLSETKSTHSDQNPNSMESVQPILFSYVADKKNKNSSTMIWKWECWLIRIFISSLCMIYWMGLLMREKRWNFSSWLRGLCMMIGLMNVKLLSWLGNWRLKNRILRFMRFKRFLNGQISRTQKPHKKTYPIYGSP